MVGYGGAYALTAGVPPVHSGGNINGRIVSLKLGSNNQLPEPKSYAEMTEPPASNADMATIARGEFEYHEHCQFCHGAGAVGGRVIPDLQQMTELTHKTFLGIVLGGAHKDKGMVSFKEMISEEQAEDIHAYLIDQANKTYTLLHQSN